MKEPAGTEYAFDQYRLNPARRILTRANGDVVRLKPKALDTLVYLVEHPLELVDKEVLLREIWPNLVVEENNLTQHISALRRALGETPGEHRFIVTEPRRGYRFVAPVEKRDFDGEPMPKLLRSPTRPPWPSSLTAPRERTWLLASIALMAGAVAALLLIELALDDSGATAGSGTRPSPIAAELPTANEDARAFFSSGLDYASRRDQVGEELVIAARQFKLSVEADPDFAAGWAQLGMALLALTRSGINTSEETRNEARAAIERALALDAELPEAHIALAQMLLAGGNDPEAAFRELELAAALAPQRPEIWMARADIERRIGQMDRAIDSARRATLIDGDERLTFEALVETFRRNFDRAELLLERHLALFPNNAQTQRLLSTIPLNRDGDASGLAELSDNHHIDEGSRASAGWFAALWDGDLEAALAFLQQIPSDSKVRAFGAFNIPLPLARAQTLRAAGRQEDAEELFRAMIEPTTNKLSDNPGHPGLLTELAESLVGIGEVEEGIEFGRQVIEMAESSHDTNFSAVARLEIITRVLIPAGRFDTAIVQLDRYFSQPGPWSIEGLRQHPLVRPIRNEAGFLALVEKYKRS